MTDTVTVHQKTLTLRRHEGSKMLPTTSLRRRMTRAAASGAMLLATASLAGCGFNAATNESYTPAVGTNAQEARVDVLNAMIVTSEDGKGTFIATLVNNDTPEFKDGQMTNVDDELISVAGIDGGVTSQFEPITVPGTGYVRLSAEEGREGIDQPGIKVTGSEVKLGNFVALELTFGDADPVEMQVPVVANNGYFEGEDDGEVVPTDKPGYGEEEEHGGDH